MKKDATLGALIATTLVAVAVIHLLPLAGVLGPVRLTALYGIPADEPNLEILLRHRAVLFGLLGAFLLTAAFRTAYRPAAFVAGYVSVLSFLALAGTVGGYNPHLARVVTADWIALACLIAGTVAHLFRQRSG